MAIAYLSSASNGINTNTTPVSVQVTKTSTAGNTLVLFAGANNNSQGVVTSVIDSNSTSWTQAIAAPGGNAYGELWYILASPSISSVTVVFTGGAAGVIYLAGVSEFSGVISAGSANKSSGTSQNPSITQSITAANNWIASGMFYGGSAGFSATAGHLEYTNSSVAGSRSVQGDNTSASVGAVTTTFHTLNSSQHWTMASMELSQVPASNSGVANSLMMTGWGI